MFGWFKRKPIPREADREFFSKVAGVSHKNSDRSTRQKIIREKVYQGERLELRHDDNNKHDKFAVALFSSGGGQIGYLESRLARDVRGWQAEGCSVEVIVKEVTGGEGKELNGVNILLRIWEPDEPSMPS
jgi:hypothetical protein